MACALAGCAVGPDFHAPPAPQLRGYTAQPLQAAAHAADVPPQLFAAGHDVAGEWWGLFRSPRLTGLVVEALARNPSLEASRQTLRQAEETTLAAEGGYFPQIGYNGNRLRQKVSLGQLGLNAPVKGFATSEQYSVYTAQVGINYTFDVWGQTRRTVEGDAALADSKRFELLGAANTLAANTANAAINAAALEEEIAAEQKLVTAEQRLLATVRRQFELGGATGTDVATQETQLANTEALVVPLQTQLTQTRDQLAAYIGRAPSEADIPPITLDELTLPGELPVSLPSSLVEQRPDVRDAQAQWHAATAQVGVAVANRLPQFTLAAYGGSAPAAFGQLFTPGNGFFSLTTEIAGPIFAGGTLLHQQLAAQAAMRAAAAAYANVVVGAFQNVADVLTALTQYQQAVISLIRARAARFTDTVALYAALGGGWWNRTDIAPPPEGLLRSLLP